MDLPISIVGVPMDLGQMRRGVDMGPAALRYAGLDERLRNLGCRLQDHGNVEIPVRDELPAAGGMAYLPAVIRACEEIYREARRTLGAGELPIFLGGDHSIALGTVAAAAAEEPVGVIWVDAHGDFNTPETSPSGNLHGMPLAALTGRGARPMVDLGHPGAKIAGADAALIGLRSIDPGERELLRGSGAAIYTMREIDERGMAQVAYEALERLGHRRRLHVSLDMDSLDPREAPGVGTPVPGGLTYREAHLLMEILAASGRVRSIDVVEINPILDSQNRTAKVAIELVASLLGTTIM